jgi:hypothetical protein
MDLDKTATQMVYVGFYSKYMPIKHKKSLDKSMGGKVEKNRNIQNGGRKIIFFTINVHNIHYYQIKLL